MGISFHIRTLSTKKLEQVYDICKNVCNTTKMYHICIKEASKNVFLIISILLVSKFVKIIILFDFLSVLML